MVGALAQPLAGDAIPATTKPAAAPGWGGEYCDYHGPQLQCGRALEQSKSSLCCLANEFANKRCGLGWTTWCELARVHPQAGVGGRLVWTGTDRAAATLNLPDARSFARRNGPGRRPRRRRRPPAVARSPRRASRTGKWTIPRRARSRAARRSALRSRAGELATKR
jgi:hypothetical protein